MKRMPAGVPGQMYATPAIRWFDVDFAACDCEGVPCRLQPSVRTIRIKQQRIRERQGPRLNLVHYVRECCECGQVWETIPELREDKRRGDDR